MNPRGMEWETHNSLEDRKKNPFEVEIQIRLRTRNGPRSRLDNFMLWPVGRRSVAGDTISLDTVEKVLHGENNIESRRTRRQLPQFETSRCLDTLQNIEIKVQTPESVKAKQPDPRGFTTESLLNVWKCTFQSGRLETTTTWSGVFGSSSDHTTPWRKETQSTLLSVVSAHSCCAVKSCFLQWLQFAYTWRRLSVCVLFL